MKSTKTQSQHYQLSRKQPGNRKKWSLIKLDLVVSHFEFAKESIERNLVSITWYQALIAKKNLCQKWDSNPRLEDQTATWTQRLRPLGHPDISLILTVNQQMAFMHRFSVTIHCALDLTEMPHYQMFHMQPKPKIVKKKRLKEHVSIDARSVQNWRRRRKWLERTRKSW